MNDLPLRARPAGAGPGGPGGNASAQTAPVAPPSLSPGRTAETGAVADPRAGTEMGGYHLVDRIGSGGMGVVYRAIDADDRVVALKLLHPHISGDAEARERLRREVAVLQRVRHRAVARVLDAEADDLEAFIVTELIPGVTLDASVQIDGTFAGEELADFADDLREALDAIHAAGVVHRDLKPSNVMVTPDQGPVLIDFGIAQVRDDTRLTQTGLVVGTPGYLSPELLRGGGVDEASDWWAWAAVLLFAATGRPAFGRGAVDVVLARVHGGQVDVDGLPADVGAVFRRALAHDRADRPSPAETVAALARCAGRWSAPEVVRAAGPGQVGGPVVTAVMSMVPAAIPYAPGPAVAESPTPDVREALTMPATPLAIGVTDGPDPYADLITAPEDDWDETAITAPPLPAVPAGGWPHAWDGAEGGEAHVAAGHAVGAEGNDGDGVDTHLQPPARRVDDRTALLDRLPKSTPPTRRTPSAAPPYAAPPSAPLAAPPLAAPAAGVPTDAAPTPIFAPVFPPGSANYAGGARYGAAGPARAAMADGYAGGGYASYPAPDPGGYPNPAGYPDPGGYPQPAGYPDPAASPWWPAQQPVIRPRRMGSILVGGLAVVVTTLWLPLVGIALILFTSWLAAAVAHGGAALDRRRAQRGQRRQDTVAVAAATPWYAIRAAIPGLVRAALAVAVGLIVTALVWTIAAGGGDWFSHLRDGAIATTMSREMELLGLGLGALIAVAMVVLGPMGEQTRDGLARAFRGLAPPPWGPRVVVGGALIWCVVVGAILAMGTGPVW